MSDMTNISEKIAQSVAIAPVIQKQTVTSNNLVAAIELLRRYPLGEHNFDVAAYDAGIKMGSAKGATLADLNTLRQSLAEVENLPGFLNDISQIFAAQKQELLGTRMGELVRKLGYISTSLASKGYVIVNPNGANIS